MELNHYLGSTCSLKSSCSNQFSCYLTNLSYVFLQCSNFSQIKLHTTTGKENTVHYKRSK